MLAPLDAPRPHAAIAPDGTVEGYASLFGEIDQARDMVMPGAFAASLRTRPIRRVPMLFQHDPSEPIGIWLDLREDFRGLYARGRLIPEVVRARELYALELSLLECPAFALTVLHALWNGHEAGINGFANLSALLMTYFAARFGVLGVYVTGRTREKQTGVTGDLPPSAVAAVLKAVKKK